VRTVSYQYDSNGRLTGLSDPSATYVFAYDADDRLTSVNNAGTPGVPNVVLTFSYDARDNRVSLADNLGGRIDYTYDAADRLTSAALSVTGTAKRPAAEFTYNLAGWLTRITRRDASLSSSGGGTTSGGGSGGGSPSGGGSGGGSTSPSPAPVVTDFSYDPAARITGITHKNSSTGATLASYALSYDAAGQLVREVSSADGTLDFTYDPRGQLTGVSGWRSEAYTFDAVGNRTLAGYQTGTNNQLLSDGSFNYAYDAEGNLLSKTEIATGTTTEYTWDQRNRLTRVLVKSASGQTVRESNYTYDPFDRRIGVRVDPDGAGPQAAQQTWTVYDGANPYAGFSGSGALTDRYLYGAAVDQILADLEADGDLYWYLSDHLGTVRDLADSTATVVDHLRYDSFGRVLSESSPSVGDRFKYTGREYDSATGLYYYRARYYDPATGRFLSQDPLGFGGDDENLYRYVGNDPVNLTDPSGLRPPRPEGPPRPQYPSRPNRGQSGGGSVPPVGFRTWYEYDLYENMLFEQMRDYYRQSGRRGTPRRPYENEVRNFQQQLRAMQAQANAQLAYHALRASQAGAPQGEIDRILQTPYVVPPGYRGNPRIDQLQQLRDRYYRSQIEYHHNLPREHIDYFRRAGLNIEDYVEAMRRDDHRLSPGGIHTGSNNWNRQWHEYIKEYPKPDANAIREQLRQMREQRGMPPLPQLK
jgi:RHS repeat-associated protein